jgi:hypothetical protein
MDPGTDWVASDGKMALDFDGSDDYVDIFIPQMSSKILGTITGWIKGTAGQGQYQRIWSLGFPSNTELVTYTNHGVDAIEVRPGNTGVTLNSGVTANGVWNHITVVMYSATFVEIYVNGNLADSNAATTVGGFDVSGQIRIGEIAFGSSGYCMAMQCDDIRIYNRAITPSEIALLAQRRGIAYETRRVPVVKGAAAGSGFKSAWSVGSNIVIGV